MNLGSHRHMNNRRNRDKEMFHMLYKDDRVLNMLYGLCQPRSIVYRDSD